MDQFKPEEMKAMEIGGNQKAHDWMEGEGLDMSLKPQEKYNSDIAQDYKDKLAAEIQGVEWVRQKREPVSSSSGGSRKPLASSNTSAGSSISNRRFGDGNTQSSSDPTQKERNETYFSNLGKVNESRPDNLPPSQGGKYGGFGNTPQQPHPDSAASAFDNFSSDPLGSMTKGWNIFAKTVSRSVDQVNETYIKPGVKNFQEGEYGQTTRKAVLQFGQKVQETSKYGIDTLNSFTTTNTSTTRQKGGNSYSKLFDDLGEPNFQSEEPIEPAFGLAKPNEHTKLQSIANQADKGKKKSGWDQDDWEKF